MTIGSKIIRELLENGVHFGHQTNKWNPKMEKFIFGEKSGIYIIDLKKTEQALIEAMEMIHDLAATGKMVLFAGTKKQAKQIVREEAQRCGMFFVDERWLGGCLTNFTTVRRSVEKLNHLQEMKASEVYESLAKKEKARIDREEQKLLRNLEGIRDMARLPDCLVVVDAEAQMIAIKEARKIGIPVVALIDTNCDPDLIDFPIPGNDDAIRSIKYIISMLADSAGKGRMEFTGEQPDDKAKVEEKVEVEEKEEIQEEEKVEAEEESLAVEKEEPEEEIVREVAAEEKEEEAQEEADSGIEEVAEGDIKLDDD